MEENHTCEQDVVALKTHECTVYAEHTVKITTVDYDLNFFHCRLVITPVGGCKALTDLFHHFKTNRFLHTAV